MKQTNIQKIREIAISLLYIEMCETELSPLIVSHPYFDSAYLPQKNGDPINVLENPSAIEYIRNIRRRQIEQGDVNRIIGLINKPYRLFYVKCCWDYMSDKDRAESLKFAWITSENTNHDVNVNRHDIQKMLREVKKEYFMSTSDFEKYKSLSDGLIVYRGIQHNAKEDGFSWTLSKEKAKWFASRFNNHGKVIERKVQKKDIVAYINDMNEQEIILNV